MVLDGGTMAGTVVLKMGKPNARNGKTSFSTTVSVLGEKKWTAKTTAVVDGSGPVSVSFSKTSGGTIHSMTVEIGGDALSGSVDGLEIIGTRNVSAAKESRASEYANWAGAWNVAFKTSSAAGTGAAAAAGFSTLRIQTLAKGKAKIAGIMGDGTKVSITGLRLLLAEDGEEACVPVSLPMYKGKTGGFGFLLWLGENGSIDVTSLSVWDATPSSSSKFTAALEPVAAATFETVTDGAYVFTLDADAFPQAIGGKAVDTSLLPSQESLELFSTKFTVSGDNTAKLKLKRKPATGACSGSFKAFVSNGTKTAAKTVKLEGLCTGGVFYGTAFVKGAGSAPFTASTP